MKEQNREGNIKMKEQDGEDNMKKRFQAEILKTSVLLHRTVLQLV
jgi:hypothetical protein